MGKRLMLALAVVLIVSSACSAFDFWGGLLNGAFHFGSGPAVTDTESGAIVQPGVLAGGEQSATASGTSGVSGVGQAAGVIGTQEADADSQEQSLMGGLGQIAFQTGDSSATGTQSGGVLMGQTSGTFSQFQFIAATQTASVTGDGSQGYVVQTVTVTTEQSQEE